MKKTVLAIAFAVATMPLTFAAQTPANPPANNAGSITGKAGTTKTKTNAKKHHRKSATTNAAKPSNGAAATPQK
jgi:opacity protein-like surface antigen